MTEEKDKTKSKSKIPSNLCFGCGGLKRPELILRPVETAELDRLLELNDWRAWAMRLLELSKPELQEAREKFADVLGEHG